MVLTSLPRASKATLRLRSVRVDNGVVLASVGTDLAIAALLVLLVVVLIPLRISLDRKARLRRGQADPPWLGAGAFSVWAVVPGDKVEAVTSLASRTLAAMGARDVSTPFQGVVVGWTGTMWLNVPQVQAYELVVVVGSQEEDGLHCLCSARPRKLWAAALTWTWWYVWGGNQADDRAEELARRLMMGAASNRP